MSLIIDSPSAAKEYNWDSPTLIINSEGLSTIKSNIALCIETDVNPDFNILCVLQYQSLGYEESQRAKKGEEGVHRWSVR